MRSFSMRKSERTGPGASTARASRRRFWRSMRMRARVVLPTRKGPSMTMKRGGWGVRCGVRARLAAEESLPGIVFVRSRHGRDQQADYSRVGDGVTGGSNALAMGAIAHGWKNRNIFTFMD